MDRYTDWYDRAYRSATTGENGLSAQELAALVAELQETADPRIQQKLLHILGYAANRLYQALVEPFLLSTDRGVAQQALTVLCRYWDLTDAYIEQISTFIRGVPDDIGNYLQITAMNIAFDYLRERFDPRLWQALIAVAETGETAPGSADAAIVMLYRLSGSSETDDDLIIRNAKARLLRADPESLS